MQISIAELSTLAGALIVLGVQLNRIAALRERIFLLEKGARSQGARLEQLHVTLTRLETLIGVRRRHTIGPDPAESSDDEPSR